MKTIYCDESGFTGNNLWQIDQPYFVYSAVEIDSGHAKDLIDEAKRRFKLNVDELHTLKLIRKPRGLDAVKWLLQQTSHSTRIAVFEKRFSLAGKMFEYLLEPIISVKSKVFYDIGFHKFVSNALYISLLVKPEQLAATFQKFQDLMRQLDLAVLNELIEVMADAEEHLWLKDILSIVVCNKGAIVDELESIRGSAAETNWVLELTLTSLRCLLTHFSGPEMHPLKVICDESKPLLAQAKHLDSMGLGRKDYHSLKIDGRECPITFNLSEPIELASSKNCAGLQIADVASSAASAVLKGGSPDLADFWNEHCSNTIEEAVVPDDVELDLSTLRAARNSLLLSRLAQQSILGINLIASLKESLLLAHEAAGPFSQEAALSNQK